jgi:hypothetical protein
LTTEGKWCIVQVSGEERRIDMTAPNKTLPEGTRLMFTADNGDVAPLGVWMTLVGTKPWDGTEWYEAVTDNGETLWLRTDSEVFSSATYHRG